jgi:hypothetical protein
MKLRLRHDNGEVKELEILVARNGILEVHWPLCGAYEYHLEKDVLTFGKKIVAGWHAESRTVVGCLYASFWKRAPKEILEDWPVSPNVERDREAYRRMK